jgi:hypothetical protein
MKNTVGHKDISQFKEHLVLFTILMKALYENNTEWYSSIHFDIGELLQSGDNWMIVRVNRVVSGCHYSSEKVFVRDRRSETCKEVDVVRIPLDKFISYPRGIDNLINIRNTILISDLQDLGIII